MGMDVYGINPQSETGEYFRNNVWWWHPLAEYCQLMAPEICKACDKWHKNSGAGLNADGVLELAKALEEAVKSGQCKKYEEGRKARIGGHRNACVVEETTDLDLQKLVRRALQTNSFDSPDYPFTTENVVGFIRFLRDCGGFRIC